MKQYLAIFLVILFASVALASTVELVTSDGNEFLNENNNISQTETLEKKAEIIRDISFIGGNDAPSELIIKTNYTNEPENSAPTGLFGAGLLSTGILPLVLLLALALIIFTIVKRRKQNKL